METPSKINPVAPENPSNPKDEFRTHNNGGRTLGGIVIITVGAALLARQIGIDIPGWLFSWPTFLIVIGIYVGARHSFRNPVWLVPTIIGTVFLLNNNFFDFELSRFFWPLVIITIGLLMIFKNRTRNSEYYKQWRGNLSESNASEDVIECVTIFGGTKKNIISKDFRGGEAVTCFGGTELNLMQADTTQRIVLELVQVFGGTKLIIPPHWRVNTEEMVTILGGLNDKRPMASTATTTDTKVVVIKGVCIFGGIDIKSY